MTTNGGAGPHGPSLQTMLKDYAKWIPGGDGGRNRDAINDAIGAGAARYPCSPSK